MLNIAEPVHYRIALLHLAFRPFFLLAGLYAIAGMAAWWWFYHFNGQLGMAPQLSTITWHAHEMIYGYALAVIAGFLLTAVKNWTGIQTLHGIPLLILAIIWCLARLMPFIALPTAAIFMMIFDLLFNLMLSLAVLYPIIKSKQWSQLAIWGALVLLMICNGVFYFGLMNTLEISRSWGIYAGLYLVLLLILLMARRVIPFFIEKGVAESFTAHNRLWLDVSSAVLMIVFIVVEVFLFSPLFSAALAVVLCLLHVLRMAGWYTPGIWQRPLLWILYLAYGWIVIGFALKAASGFQAVPAVLATHAFTVGGVGLMTLGMMTRVTLGHTGRNVFQPPGMLTGLFLIIIIASLVRVIFPLVAPHYYVQWIAISQFLWISAFAVFVGVFAPMLWQPRIDGRYG